MNSISKVGAMLVENGVSIRKYHKILNVGIGIFLPLSILIPLWALVTYVLLEKGDLQWNQWLVTLSNKEGDKRRSALIDKQVDQPFTPLTEERPYRMPLPVLSDKLVVLEHIVRPDFAKTKKAILLGLDGGAQKRLACVGERIFLHCKNEREVAFTEEVTPFWIEPAMQANGEVAIALQMECKGEAGENIYSSTTQFCLQEKKEFTGASCIEQKELLPIIAYLEKITLSPSDRLLALYGGASFDPVKAAYRMWDGRGRFLFFIKPGDIFVWKEGRLERGEGETQGLPLVLVRSITPQKCEIVAWDKEGLYGKPVMIEVSKHSPFLLKSQEAFVKVHQRTGSSVTCQLQQRNLILREGDWLLHTKGRFRNLRTSEEVKEFLRYALKGELFIFDGIVKKEGGSVFVGHLFNEDRTEEKVIEIPLSERKKPSIPRRTLKVDKG